MDSHHPVTSLNIPVLLLHKGAALSFTRIKTFLSIIVAATIAYQVGRAIYRYYFHPLRAFPGPKLAAISDIWYAYVSVTGRSTKILKNIHEKYGPIVRIAPNDLSFATPSAWREINVKTGDRKAFPKAEFYDGLAEGFGCHGVASERDIEKHARGRKLISPAFCPQAIRDYEKVILHHLGLFRTRIEGVGIIDAAEWFNFLTFDTAGDFVFSEDFGAVAQGFSHRWMSLISDNIDILAYLEAIRRFPVVNYIADRLFLWKLRAAQQHHFAWTKEKTDRRVHASGSTGHKDMLSYILAQQESKSVTHTEMTAHASQLIFGGSETLSTFMAGTLYHLMRTPRVMARLRAELDDAFTCIGDITNEAFTANPHKFKYLDALIKEGLRMFPPAPTSLPRHSLGEYVDGVYIPAGVRVSIPPWMMSRSAMLWDSPDELRPERWLEENSDAKEATQPFMLGIRGCSGKQLAWMSMRLSVCTLFWGMDWNLTEPEFDWEDECSAYTTWMKPPLMVAVQRRQGVKFL